MRKFNVKRDMPGLQQEWFEYRVMEQRGIEVWGPTETRIRYIMFVLLQDVYSRSEMRLIRRPCKESFSRMFRSFVTKRLTCFSSRFQDGGCCCQLYRLSNSGGR
ncbi:hypothetical protein JG688_00018103 [Phytophthora aleatoria]|uniref:Uncharacterized protein n=1 Tax=Phytophthora aleatoria TaxID=2496075 RepID=A0A8J5IRV6_9STRA|nr:hypothetical protein JG688_00018103 [Phytophthora aleatoria]